MNLNTTPQDLIPLVAWVICALLALRAFEEPGEAALRIADMWRVSAIAVVSKLAAAPILLIPILTIAAMPEPDREMVRFLIGRHLALSETINSRDLEDPAVIDGHASASGVDLAAMHAAFANGTAAGAVTEAEMVGRTHGVQGTPSWLVQRRLIVGLRSAAEFERLAISAFPLTN